MSKIDKEYHDLLEKILQEGYTYEDTNRKGVNRLEISSYTFRHEFKNGFPAITTKKLHYKNVVTELIWFLRGDTNIKYLVDNDCNIWNKDGYSFYKKCYEKYPLGKDKMSYEEWLEKQKKGYSKHSGDLGRIYGFQWRNWMGFNQGFDEAVRTNGDYTKGIDQISNLIKNLKEKPLATDHIVNAWNVGDLDNMALPPCHYGFQIVVRPLSTLERVTIYQPNTINDNILSDAEFTISKFLDENNIAKYGFELHWSQRSVDTFLGLSYNVSSYATLALILEKITGYKALAIQGDLKKVHLYDNSLDAVKEQLGRNADKYDKCELLFKDEFHYITDKELVGEFSLDKIISKMEPDWFLLENYESYPAINVEMLERDE